MVPDEKDWTKISEGRAERPWWSPDGNLLYSLDRRDGNECIWAQTLDPATKRPKGEAFAVQHFHEARLQEKDPLSFGPAIVPDGLIFSLLEMSRNVWIGELQK